MVCLVGSRACQGTRCVVPLMLELMEEDPMLWQHAH